MANLRFMKVFVADPSTKFVFAGGTKPPALTAGQVGAFNVDQFGISTGGATATPAPGTVRRIKIAQNVGDSAFGTVKSQIINLESVVGWRGYKATVPTTQITYIGYDEVDGNKDITAVCGQELVFPIQIWEKKMARWYGPVGFRKTIVVNTGCCPDCGSPCTAADKTYIATQIAAGINSPLTRPNDYAATNELPGYVLATVVNNGGSGSALRVGVKIETLATVQNAEPSLNTCDPQKWWELQAYSFTVGDVITGNGAMLCSGVLLPITTTQIENPGSGWSAGLAALEAESQGFDRVRDPAFQWPYSSHNGYKILAVAATKYDYYILDYNYTHRVTTGTTSFIHEPYEAILAVPTTTGGTVETFFNTWLANRFPAVVL